jgi:hypothetical protein
MHDISAYSSEHSDIPAAQELPAIKKRAPRHYKNAMVLIMIKLTGYFRRQSMQTFNDD